MMVYILFFTLLIWGVTGNLKSKRHGYLFFVIFVLWLIMGLRSKNMGFDTPSYVDDFFSFSRMSFSQITQGVSGRGKIEPLYSLVSWFVSQFSNSYSSFLLVWALFPAVGMYVFFRRNLSGSFEYAIALFVLFMTGLFAFFVTGIRQTAAISVLLIGYTYFNNIRANGQRNLLFDSNLWKLILCLFIAYLCHNTSIVFILIIPLSFVRFRWWYLLIAASSYLLSQYVQLDYIRTISALLFEDRYSQYGDWYDAQLSMAGFFMQLIMTLICAMKIKTLVKIDRQNNLIMNIMLLGLIFQSLTGIIADLSRVSYYFTSFSMLLVPRSLSLIRNTQVGKLFTIMFVILCLVYLFFLSSANLPEYESSISWL